MDTMKSLPLGSIEAVQARHEGKLDKKGGEEWADLRDI